MALGAFNAGRFAESLGACQELLQKHPESKEASAAATIGRLLTAAPTTTAELPNPQQMPPVSGVHPVVGHILFPDPKPVAFDYAALNGGDLLYYSLTYSTRSRCIKINSWTMGLSEFEPQVPRTRERTLRYLRAPVLFRNIGASY